MPEYQVYELSQAAFRADLTREVFWGSIAFGVFNILILLCVAVAALRRLTR